MMITIKNFSIWSKEITIDDNGNEITINGYEEVSNSDYKTVRYFKYKGQGYLFISNMFYQCKLVYSIKEIEEKVSATLEKQINNLKRCDANTIKLEKELCKAIELKTNIEKNKDIYWGSLEEYNNAKQEMNKYLEENFAI